MYVNYIKNKIKADMKYWWQRQKNMNKLLWAMKNKKDAVFNLTVNQNPPIV